LVQTLKEEFNAADEFKRWARIGVDQDGIKYMPAGGICLMAYVVSMKGDSILAATMNGETESKTWRDRWGMLMHRDRIWKGKWLVPSGFLRFGEDPKEAANRLLSEMMGMRNQHPKLANVVTYSQPSKYYLGFHHWHVCFIYEIGEVKVEKVPPWFHAIEYVPLKGLTEAKVAVEGGPVLRRLGLLSSK
jgi:ADP-ribose pyrophosphatase YjhB (NUDIX family)